MAQQNMGFGQRFKLGEAYSPTLQDARFGQQGMVQLQPTAMGMAPQMMQAPQQAGPGGMPAFGVPGQQQQPNPSLLDVGLAQQQQPGGLLGFGNNTAEMTGAGAGASPNWGGAISQGLGLLAQGQGGEEAGPTAPLNPGAGIIRAPQNDKLQRLLAQYNITGV